MKSKRGEQHSCTVDYSRVGRELQRFITAQYKKKFLSPELYQKAKLHVAKNLILWYTDPVIAKISPHTQPAIHQAISEKRWADICELYSDDIAFGTAGIRGRSVVRAFDVPDPQDELVCFARDGLDAKILKGPNTINDIVILLKSAGIARYAKDKSFSHIVVGYDSRINGRAFAELVTQLFIAYGLTVYLFDEAVPYPELMFAVSQLRADLGIYISASHNDKRYNGYKVCRFGAQLDAIDRIELYEHYIRPVTTKDIMLTSLAQAAPDKLFFLGGQAKIPGAEYYDSFYPRKHIDMHILHFTHCMQFILNRTLLRRWSKKLAIGYAAFHGAGRKQVPNLLVHAGCTQLFLVEKMQDLNGLFPLFSIIQQPDPGDEQTMQIAMDEFIREHGTSAFEKLDLFIGTDPDADRAGFVVSVPENQRKLYGGTHVLLSADEIWTALLWYRLYHSRGFLSTIFNNPGRQFVAFTHVTTDAIGLLAKHYGLGYVRTWVGFSFLASAIRHVWMHEDLTPEKNPSVIYACHDMNSRRTWNVFACEQSNGFSICGDIPKNMHTLGTHGHVKDKDGTLAALLVFELTTYAKSHGTTIIELLDTQVYCNPAIGLIVTAYEPLPRFGQFEGLDGMSRKLFALKKTQSLIRMHERGKSVSIAGLPVVRTAIYRTGKYDTLHNWPGFPDEGMRFFFGEYSHITLRPSGTSQSLRIHVQIRDNTVTRDSIVEKKRLLHKQANAIIQDFKKKIGIRS
ncbi:MAG: hypothetical protein WC916_05855 [Candidatus Woesearchaeota archaeon]